MNKLTIDQIKTLQLFSYYCRSYGADEVNLNIYLSDCDVDYIPDEWSKGSGIMIGGYPEINGLIKELIVSNNIIESIEMDCDYSGNLNINIDCIEKTIEFTADMYVMGDNEMSDSIDSKEDDVIYETCKEIFDKLSNEGFEEGVVEFNGGGDSGEIYDKITFDDEIDDDISNNVLNFLYEWLGSFYGGWEINEGSHGRFVFYPDRTINLEFYEHVENTESLGRIFYSKF